MAQLSKFKTLLVFKKNNEVYFIKKFQNLPAVVAMIVSKQHIMFVSTLSRGKLVRVQLYPNILDHLFGLICACAASSQTRLILDR